jgi:hypothetical protein
MVLHLITKKEKKKGRNEGRREGRKERGKKEGKIHSVRMYLLKAGCKIVSCYDFIKHKYYIDIYKCRCI